MEDLISREAAISAMYLLQIEDEETYGCSIPEGFDGERAAEALRKLPSAEPERRKGKWIDTTWKHTYKCSECGNFLEFHGVNAGRGDANFCPNCGADMRGDR